MRQLWLSTASCLCLALLLLAASPLPAAAAQAAAHAAPAASTTDADDEDDADDADDAADEAPDPTEQQLGNCATLGEAVRRFAIARDRGMAKMDAFKDVTRGKSAYVAGSLLDQTLQWPYDHPAEQPITTASHFYHRCVLDALDSLDPASEDELNKLSASCQQQNASKPDAVDDCIAARTDAIVDRYHGNAPPAVTRTPASAFTPFAFITDTPLIAAAPRPGARAKPVAAPPKVSAPLEATPAVAATPAFTKPQAAPLLAAAPAPAAAVPAQVSAPPVPLEETPASASAALFTPSEAAPLLAAVSRPAAAVPALVSPPPVPLEETPASASAALFTPFEAAPLLAAVSRPAAAVPALVSAPPVPLEETPATASAPAYAQPESAALLAATAAPAVAPPAEVSPPPAPAIQPAAPQAAAPAPAPAPVAVVAAVVTPPAEVVVPAPAPAPKTAREGSVAGNGPASAEVYGKLRLGMPMTDAIKLFSGYPDIEKDAQGNDAYVFLVAGGNAFITLHTSPTHPGQLYGIQVTGGPEAKQAPVAGVLLGDTSADLVAKIGEPSARTPAKDYHTLWSYTGRNYSFEVSDGGDVISLLIYGYAGTPDEQAFDQGAAGASGF